MNDGKTVNNADQKARERVYHASRLLKYRRPFGAQPEGGFVDLFFECPKKCREVTLCYTYGLYKFSYHEEPMSFIGGMFKVGLMLPDESGMLFYWFRFIDEEDNILYYVAEADTRYGEGKVYFEPPRIGPEEDKYPYAFQITIYDKSFHTPDRIKGAMIYQIFPDRFARSDDFNYNAMINSCDRPERIYHRDWYEDVDIYGKPDTGYLACDFYGGSLRGIAQKMDYIKSLGITILYLNPIFEARSSHRYDTADYMNVDTILGGNSAFNELVIACKEAQELSGPSKQGRRALTGHGITSGAMRTAIHHTIPGGDSPICPTLTRTTSHTASSSSVITEL